MSKSKPKSKSRNKWFIIGSILVIGALLTAAFIKSKKQPKGEEVTIEKAQKRTIRETVAASGKIYPETEVKISSDVSGEIVELYVEEGDSVKTGQLLAKIDPDAYFSAVERGEASLNASKSAVSNAKSNIESARAQKEQIVSQLENARTIHKRNESLLSDGVISQADYDQSLTSVRQLEANLRAAEASINASTKNAEGAEYQVKSAEASLKELKTSLSRTSIKAPTNGIVSSLSVEQGERVVGTIQMTGTEMMRIANLNSMEVQVDVSENDILKVSVGDEVDIEVDAYLDKTFKGRVTEVANSASNISGTALNTDQVTNFVVKVRIEPSSYKDIISGSNQYPFRPGMSASVDIYTNDSEQTISVPIQAVTVREKKSEKDDKSKKSKDDKSGDDIDEKDLDQVVFLMVNDTAKMVKVVTGIQDDEYITVLEGLTDSVEVVTGPYSAVSKKIKSGMLLRIKKEKEKKE